MSRRTPSPPACECGRVWKENVRTVLGTLPPCPLGLKCKAHVMCGERMGWRFCRLVYRHEGSHEQDGVRW